MLETPVLDECYEILRNAFETRGEANSRYHELVEMVEDGEPETAVFDRLKEMTEAEYARCSI